MRSKLLRAVLPLSMGAVAACSSAGTHVAPSTSATRAPAGPVATLPAPSADHAVDVAQANVRNALTAELTVFTDNEQFSHAADLSAVLTDVPLADYPPAPAALAPGTVYVAVLDPTVVELSAVAGTSLYTVVENGDPNSDTQYGITAASAGRPQPSQVTASSW